MLINHCLGSRVILIFSLIATLLVILNAVRGKDTRNTSKNDPNKRRPNIVFIYTDDQDDILGSLHAMPNLQKYVMEKGVRFTNSFVSTPLCCPSRSAMATGRYAHNTGAVNNYEHCGSDEFLQKELPKTWTVLLQTSGYRTFYAGKYIHRIGNISEQEIPGDRVDPVGGTHISDNNSAIKVPIPPGWDWFNRWSQPQGQKYYDYNMDMNGTRIKFGSETKDYLTTVIQNLALDFIRFSAVDEKPFFMMVAPLAPHMPYLYEAQFDDVFKELKALRTPSFGRYGPDKHWIVRSMEKEPSEANITKADRVYRDRWRTLISVDRMIVRILNQLQKSQKLDNTIIVFSSDNGYHMGQFNLPIDKRKAYEFDIKVPLIFMGPGIAENISRPDLVQNIDLGPTFLDLAGVKEPGGTWHDGKSIAPLLSGNKLIYNKASKNWRRFLLVEYTGECNNKKYNKLNERIDVLGDITIQCESMDSVNNTYSCVRQIDGNVTNDVYCEYDDVEHFREYYDLKMDPWQLKNTFKDMAEGKKQFLKKKLTALKSCRGDSCWLQ